MLHKNKCESNKCIICVHSTSVFVAMKNDEFAHQFRTIVCCLLIAIGDDISISSEKKKKNRNKNHLSSVHGRFEFNSITNEKIARRCFIARQTMSECKMKTFIYFLNLFVLDCWIHAHFSVFICAPTKMELISQRSSHHKLDPTQDTDNFTYSILRSAMPKRYSLISRYIHLLIQTKKI